MEGLYLIIDMMHNVTNYASMFNSFYGSRIQEGEMALDKTLVITWSLNRQL